MIIPIAYAQGPGVAVAVSFLATFTEVILYPLLLLMMGIAFLFFLYGCFEYIIQADNETARATGRQHILWGIVGLLVMLSAMSILRIAVGTFGLDEELRCADNPGGAGCERFMSPDGGSTGFIGGPGTGSTGGQGTGSSGGAGTGSTR